MIRRIGLSLSILLAAALAAGGCAGTRAGDSYDDPYYEESYGDYPADVGYFYDDLAPYGHWYQRAPYGWVWSPSNVPIGWRPYTVGSWAYSDWGWTWMSADPWGYAPYHYGRWTYDSFYGWLWLPDDVWAPSWVAWRYGDGYVGWAPLPPDAVWSGYGLDYSGSIDPSRWTFTRERDFVTSRNRTEVLPITRNRTLVGRTKDVTRYSVVDGRPAERGLGVSVLEKSTGRSVPRYKLVPKATGAEREAIRGRTIVVPRPAIPRDARYRMKESPPPAAARETRDRTRTTADEAPELREPRSREERETATRAEREAQAREQRQVREQREKQLRERREQQAREKRETDLERRAREREEREEMRLRERQEREAIRARAREERERAREQEERAR